MQFLALLIGVARVVKYWWLIGGIVAGLVARADQQHAWVMQGDERGVYGEFSPAPV
jgi:hypothetical protein